MVLSHSNILPYMKNVIGQKSFYINELLKCYAIKELIIKYKPTFYKYKFKKLQPDFNNS